MQQFKEVSVSLPSDMEIQVDRSFSAPRQLVWDCHTKPELVKRWLYGPEEWPIVACEMDVRPGGSFNYVWRHEVQGEMVLRGTYRTVERPQRMVHTELFDQDWTGGETVVTSLFDEKDGVTTLTMTILYSSREARDGALKTGMTEGMSQSYIRLDEVLTQNT
jgi:uncharacterized protein YndB with AHSA1/START domain